MGGIEVHSFASDGSFNLPTPTSVPADMRGAPSCDDMIGGLPGHCHTVQFYEDDAFLASAVADFLAVGLTSGQPVVVIATDAHREAFVERLEAEGFDVAEARKSGRVTLLDLSETLAGCLADGRPDPERFRATVGSAVERSMATGGHTSVRLYGEMVDVLWKAGKTEEAIELEELWNELGNSYDFSLLCAYSMGNFYKAEDADHFHDICRKHTHVIPAESYAAITPDARLVEISRLQQRARALEAEIGQREDLEQKLRSVLSAQRRTEEVLRQRERELRETLSEREGLLERERAARADAERAREHADEANSAKSAFLASMSHELRTPLNAIAGYVQLVELGVHGPVTDEQRTALSRAQRSQQHLLSLINDLLNFAKLEAGRVDYQIEEVSLADVIADVACMVEPQLAAKGLSYTVRIAAQDAVLADREKLQQVLLNLLSNAIKFTDAGGSVVVDTAVRDDAPSDMVYLRVTDTGCGIARDKQQLIFDPFMQVSVQRFGIQEGTGLGLAISRDLARGMGGDLRVRSVEGQGSTFTLSLPPVPARKA